MFEPGLLRVGDCLEVMKDIPDRCIDFVITDPPYGTTSIEWDKEVPFDSIWVQLKRILKPNSNILIFGNQPFTSRLVLSNEPWFKQALVWNKNKCGSPGLANKRLMQVTEDIILFSNGTGPYFPIMEEGDPYERKSKSPGGYVGRKNDHGYGLKPRSEFTNHGTRYPRNLINISRNFSAQQQVHPTQKPVPLFEYLIKTYSKPGDLGLDMFAGSGTFAIAAENTGRRWVCIEKSEEYAELIQERLKRKSHEQT